MTKLSDAIKKHRELTASIHQQEIEERRKYLQFCESEANRIYDALTDEILDDIESSGKAYVHVVGRYDNIFSHRIAGLIAEKFRDEGLELQLFNSIGIVKIFIKE